MRKAECVVDDASSVFEEIYAGNVIYMAEPRIIRGSPVIRKKKKTKKNAAPFFPALVNSSEGIWKL